MEANYLMHGANALGQALRYIDGDIEYDPRSAEIYLSIACVTLTKLHEDKETLGLISNAGRSGSEELREHLYSFLDEFIVADKALLISAGIDKKVADYLFRDIERTQEIITNPEIASGKYLEARIQELQDMACRVVHSSSRAKKILERSLYVVGGSAVVAINHLITIKTGPLLSEASKLYGGHLVGKGLNG